MSPEPLSPALVAGLVFSSTALASTLAVATRPSAVNARQPAPESLSDLLPWAALIRSGLVVNKDGSLMAIFRYRGPDLAIATEPEKSAIAAQLNQVLSELDGSWSLFVEAARIPAIDYPEVTAEHPVARLIDEERRDHFTQDDYAFETQQTLTLHYRPPADRIRRWRDLFIQGLDSDTGERSSPKGQSRSSGGRASQSDKNGSANNLQIAERFEEVVGRVAEGLRDVCPKVERLRGSALLTYLQSTVDPQRRTVPLPACPLYLDAVLAPAELVTGFAPRIGQHHLRIVSIRNYPAELSNGALDVLENLDYPARWVSRFLLLNDSDAEREVRRIRRRWFSQRKSMGALLREALIQEPTAFEDSHAVSRSADADDALTELQSGLVRYGYFTSAVVITDPDANVAEDKAHAVEHLLQSAGFMARLETVNSIDAWLGTLPGITGANVRRPLLNSLNVARMMPLHCTWAGPARDQHLDGPPLFHAVTEGRTPFRFSAHVGDAGHTLVIGPTGQGKSTLLTFMALQSLRYPTMRIVYFDKGRSARAVTLACDGAHVDLGAEESIQLQPLACLDKAPDRAWGVAWVTGLLQKENVEVTAGTKGLVRQALDTLAHRPVSERTLTSLRLLIQDPGLRQALTPYTTEGGGALLDGSQDVLPQRSWQTYELEDLFQTEQLSGPVLQYLFHRIEHSLQGTPTLIVIDEGWRVLADIGFRTRLHAWLKTLRKKNAWIVFASQSLEDVASSPLTASLSESAPIRVFLPNPRATEPATADLYHQFGLTASERTLIARAIPKRQYYVKTPDGSRLFELGLSDTALALCGAGSPDDQKLLSDIQADPSQQPFWKTFLAAKFDSAPFSEPTPTVVSR